MRAPLPPILARLLVFTPPVGLCGLIWYLSSQPTLPDTQVNDKVMHFMVYGLLSALWTRAWWMTTNLSGLRVGLSAFALTAVYGAIDELHQSFVPGRDASALDLLADAGGAAVGAALMATLYVLTLRLAPDSRK